MSVIGTIIGRVAAKAGAELVGKAVGGVFGDKGGQLAESVVASVAEKLGVEPAALPVVPEPQLIEAVKSVEAAMPEMVALWAKGLDGQFALLRAEQKEGFWQSAWRWGWMYLLALFWVWRIMIAPYVNLALQIRGYPVAELVDYAILLTLTTWFISLYMGGHTVKSLGESAINAVKSWRGRA